MATVNEELLSEAIRHALALQRYGNGAVRQIISELNRAGVDIVDQLLLALQRLPPGSFTVQRLDALLGEVRALNKAAYEQLFTTLSGQLRDLTAYELGYQRQLFETVLPPQVIVELPIAAVNAEQVAAAAMARPFQGRLLKEWAAAQESGAMLRIRDTVRNGFIEQKTIDQIVRDVRGTKRMGYADGIMNIARRDAEAVVRTAISHTAGYARDTFMAANEDLVKQQQWISTLDGRTSEPCILRDHLLYSNKTHTPVGHKYPWGAGPGRFHWQCRSTSVAVVKSFRELGIDIPEFEVKTRASMDGQVAASLSYGAWLKKQSAAVQDEVLGPTRGKLLRSGGLTVDRFANDKGRWLTLDELRARDSDAFRRAGV